MNNLAKVLLVLFVLMLMAGPAVAADDGYGEDTYVGLDDNGQGADESPTSSDEDAPEEGGGQTHSDVSW